MRGPSTRPRRVYDRLSPAERFRLAITALGRGDLAEYRYLISTAPRSTVDTLHTEIRGPFDELRAITWCFWVGAAGPIAQLRVLDGLAAAVREVYGAIPGMEDLAEGFAEFLDQARSVPATELRPWVDAYLEITTERFGLTRETMLGIQRQEVTAALERYRELLEEATPDATRSETIRTELEESMRPVDLADLEEVS